MTTAPAPATIATDVAGVNSRFAGLQIESQGAAPGDGPHHVVEIDLERHEVDLLVLE